MLKRSVTLAGLVLVAALAGCGGSDKTTVGPSAATQDSKLGSGSGMMGQCPPDMMKDVSVTLTDTETGVVVDFVTTNTEKVETLRTMVQHMAAMHTSGSSGGSCCAGGTGGGMMSGTGSGGTCSMHGGTGGSTGGGMMGGGTGGGMMGGGTGGGMMGGGTGGGMTGGSTGGGMHGGDHDSMMTGNCPMMGGGMDAFASANVVAANVDNGAQLAFTVKEGGNLDALRTAVHKMFDAMKSGQCPMMK